MTEKTLPEDVRARRESEVRRLALEIARLGTWEFEAGTDLARVDARAAQILGLSADRDFRLDDFLAVVHPADRDRVRAEIAEALAPSGPASYDSEHRVVRPDNSTVWVLSRGRCDSAHEAGPRRFIGTLMDVTPQRKAEEALRHAAELLELGDAFIEFDRQWRIVRLNRNYEKLSRRPRATLLGRVVWEVFPEVAHPESAFWREYHRCMNERVAVDFEEHYRPFDLWTGVTAYPTAVGVAVFLRDITVRKRVEAALRDSDRRKDEFIAILSHELRNPLAPIRFALPLLQQQPLPGPLAHSVAVIDRQVAHLTRLVDDLLDASRITSGKIELRRELVTLDAILADAVEAASPAILAARHTLKKPELSPGSIRLYVDAGRIAQVITNLLNNSAKYTPRGGEISLETACEDGHVNIRVRDSGMGIPREALPGVFDMFRQVDRPDTAQGGLGIGLALAKQLVEMHGGTICGFSAGAGCGAEFSVSLPLAAGACDTPRGDRPSGPPPAAHVPPDKPPSPRQRLKVLVVDDNADLVEMLSTLVAGLGHDVRKALDGKSAISAALSYRPHVILLDLGLPVVSGIEVARALRRHPELAATRLVALTGWGQDEDRRRTEEAGFDCHLTKPADPETVERLLAECAAS